MTSRQTSAAGAVFVAAFVAGLMLVNNPDGDSSPATFAAWYASRGHRVHLILAAILLSLAGLAWIVFVSGLRDRLPENAAVGRIAGACAAATSAMLGVAGTMVAAIPAAMSIGGTPAPGVDLERLLPHAAYAALTLFAMPAVALTLVVVSVAALRTGALPAALAWGGIATAVVLLASLEFFPMIALVLWVAAASVVLARRPLRIPQAITA
jgi:hypothetical protein